MIDSYYQMGRTLPYLMEVPPLPRERAGAIFIIFALGIFLEYMVIEGNKSLLNWIEVNLFPLKVKSIVGVAIRGLLQNIFPYSS